MRGYIEIKPFKHYNWIDLPQDAKIKNVKYNEKTKMIEIHYGSKSGENGYSSGSSGSECFIVPKGRNVNIIMEREGEVGEIVYSKVIDCEDDRLLIVIAKWRKE